MPRATGGAARQVFEGGCALNRATWSPVKGSSASVSTTRSAIVVRQRFFWIPAIDTDIISAQHFWTGGLETAGPGCYDAVGAAGFRMLVMSRIPHAAIVPLTARSRPKRAAKTSRKIVVGQQWLSGWVGVAAPRTPQVSSAAQLT